MEIKKSSFTSPVHPPNLLSMPLFKGQWLQSKPIKIDQDTGLWWHLQHFVHEANKYRRTNIKMMLHSTYLMVLRTGYTAGVVKAIREIQTLSLWWACAARQGTCIYIVLTVLSLKTYKTRFKSM